MQTPQVQWPHALPLQAQSLQAQPLPQPQPMHLPPQAILLFEIVGSLVASTVPTYPSPLQSLMPQAQPLYSPLWHHEVGDYGRTAWRTRWAQALGSDYRLHALAHWRLRVQVLSLAQVLDQQRDQKRLQVPYLAHVRLQALRLAQGRAPSSDGEVLS